MFIIVSDVIHPPEQNPGAVNGTGWSPPGVGTAAKKSMKSQILLALVVVLAVVPGGAAGAVTGEPALSASVADGTVTPGETTSLRLTILNTGDVQQADPGAAGLTQRVTTARGLTVTVESGDAPIDVLTGERAVGTLPEGATPPMEIPIAVDEEAETGTYDVPVEVNYTYTKAITPRGYYVEETVNRTLNVTLTVEDGASFAVTDVDAGVRVGSSGTLDVTLENTGSLAARDASLSLSSRNADLTFGAASSASRYVGAWDPGEARTVSYEVTAAPTANAHRYAMEATVGYEDGDGVPAASDTLTFAVTPRDRQRFPVVAAESNVSIGDSGTVTLTMHNDGPIAVRDATVSLTSTSAALVFGQTQTATRFVGGWAPGENRTLTFDVVATDDAETRSYALRSSVTFEDADGDQGQSPTAAVGVIPAPQQGFAFDNVQADLEVGAEGTLSGTVTNTGDVPARNVVVTFGEPPGSVTPLEAEAPVGDLAPGESASFSFPMEAGAGAEDGPRQFTLLATYRNTEDERRQSDSADVRATVAPDTPTFDVAVEGGTVAPGGSTTIAMTITNQGDDPVSDVSAKLFANDPLSTTDSEAFVADLGAGESKEVTFGIGAAGGALEKTYPLEMDFQYDDAEGDTLTSQTYRLPVSVEAVETDDGDGLPLPLLVIGALVLVAVLYLGYRRYG